MVASVAPWMFRVGPEEKQAFLSGVAGHAAGASGCQLSPRGDEHGAGEGGSAWKQYRLLVQVPLGHLELFSKGRGRQRCRGENNGFIMHSESTVPGLPSTH